jgi:endonuclease/exonuclease/phosphatase family metal-dependent hydrolase
MTEKYIRIALSAFTLLLLPAVAFAQARRDAVQRNFIARPSARHVRVMTWNIGANSIFADPGLRGLGVNASDKARPARFLRVMQKLDPDVICFQEILVPHSPADAARLLDKILPLGKGKKWSAHGEGDTAIVSRYPLAMLNGRSEDYGGGHYGGGVMRSHSMALVDLPPVFGKRDLYVLCAHVQSRGEARDIAARQAQADAIAAWMRDLMTPGGEVDLPRWTPMVLMGDWNAYKTDPAGHITTLLTGAIADEKRYGRGVLPDWDQSPLHDALPLQNATGPETYTYGDGSGRPFSPGELDRVLFTDSVLDMLGGFVLNTVTLPPETLSAIELQKDDVMRSVAPRRLYDHLPVVVDLRPRRGLQ